MLGVACIQTTSINNIAANIAHIEPMVKRAAADGANLIALPENAFYMRGSDDDILPGYGMDDHPGLLAARKWAGELGVWLLAGSVGIKGAGQGSKVYNRSVLINPQGSIAAHYDKIHLFDVEVGDGQKYHESARILPGDKAVLARCADDGWQMADDKKNSSSVICHPSSIIIGMTICYDLRFPQLYRALAKAGASIITAPSAFTVPTGEAHWHVLLRARAIENSCFIIAPAQCGTHAGGRKTYGHSLIIDPWGKVLADGGEIPGVVMATLDLAEVEKVRKNLPSLQHDHAFNL